LKVAWLIHGSLAKGPKARGRSIASGLQKNAASAIPVGPSSRPYVGIGPNLEKSPRRIRSAGQKLRRPVFQAELNGACYHYHFYSRYWHNAFSSGVIFMSLMCEIYYGISSKLKTLNCFGFRGMNEGVSTYAQPISFALSVIRPYPN